MAENFSARAEEWQGEPVVVLRDHAHNTQASIAYKLGCNCVQWSVRLDGQEYQALETPATPAVLHERASRAGVPVLWPFPGRVRNAQYTFEGQTYHLPPTDKTGIHHIHGLALRSEWQLDEQGATDELAYCVVKLSPADLSDEARAGYPFDFALYLRFELQANTLRYAIRLDSLENSRAIPFGFGLHPYFNTPLAPTMDAPDRTHCLVRIAADQEWPNEGGLPNAAAVPVAPEKDFSHWRELGDASHDDMLGGALFDGDYTVSGIRTPGLNAELQIKADHNFQNWVFFTPPDRASLAIEPYTCPPNAINMPAENIPDSNLLVLAPGQSWQAEVVLAVTTY